MLVMDNSAVSQGWGQASIDYFWNYAVWAAGNPVNVLSGPTVKQSFDEVCQDAVTSAVAATPGATTARVIAVLFGYQYHSTGWNFYGASAAYWNDVVNARFDALSGNLQGWPIYENGNPIWPGDAKNLLYTSAGSTRMRCVAANNLQLSRYGEN